MMVQTEMVYVGPVKYYQGKRADVRDPCEADGKQYIATLPLGTAMAQFEGSARWIPVPRVDFRSVGDKPYF